MKKALLVVLVVFFMFAFAPTSLADNNDLLGFIWGNSGADDLTLQDFTTTYQTKIKNRYYYWNGIADNANIDTYTWRSDMADKGKDIRIYEGQLTGTTIGVTRIYNNILGIYWPVGADFTDTIERAVITLDNRSDGLLSLSTSWQNATILHEIGHALALDHPNCGSTAIMQQGQSSPASTSITVHDRSNLIAKWD